jgi:hypothetical protein
MKKLSHVKERCFVEDGHWIWKGALSNKLPRLWAPDYTNHGGASSAQMGRRAVWHLKTGEPIPAGWRVFGTCDEPLCLNPAHMDCKTDAARGVEVAATGRLKGQVKRIMANRATNRKRSMVTPALVAEALASHETGVELAVRLGVGRHTISKIRVNGGMPSLAPVGSVFGALLWSANDSSREAA